MSFPSAFWSVLRSQPGRALGALYWRVTGRKVRARNRLRIGLAQAPGAYRRLIARMKDEDATIARDARATMAGWAYRPGFSVLVHQSPDQGQSEIDALAELLHAQTYPRWELVVVPHPGAPPLKSVRPDRVRITPEASEDGGEALRHSISEARSDYLLPLPAGAVLPPLALYRYAEALQSTPGADLLFGDHDQIDGSAERYHPWFKPQWNAELALAQDYLSQALVVSAAATRTVLDRPVTGNRAASYALALGVGSRKDAAIRHVGHIQAHLGASSDGPSNADRMAVVRTFLDGTDAGISPGAHGTVRVDWPLPDPLPLVSILIPTRDRIDLLRACLSTVEAKTRYRPFEVIVVDNGSMRADSLAYLREIDKRDGYRVIRDERPYNFSQLNNLAASQARGTYLCLLNNDTEIIEGDWLTAMMRQAARPHVGAVGAMLLYDDGLIQHAGVTIGVGEAAGHGHRFQKREAAGYFARVHAAHYVSAVTAACLVVETRKFLAVGGLDEQDLAVAFNDVDLCLKLQQAGWHNVYTPHAQLLHHESKSRGRDVSPRHIERYRRELAILQARWNTREYADPLHHARLDRSCEEYLIRL